MREYKITYIFLSGAQETKMNQNTHSKTSLFLMEIIIAILFFSLSSAVCLRLFVAAHLLAQKDQNLNHAIMWSQNFSESFAGCSGKLLMIKNQYPNAYLTQSEEKTNGTIILYFDEKWEQLDTALTNASYEAILTITKDSADRIYADVNDYGISLKGDALKGDIAILDVRERAEGFSQIPDDDDYIIIRNSVDYYLGEE